MDKHTEIILEAYSILDDITPLRYDCGTLCNRHCCKNNEKNGETLGMWLLPYEKGVLLSGDNYTFSKTRDGVETVFCNGRCNRALRPFACRIYPFYAHIETDENGRDKISVRPDPRARLSCPIVMHTSYLRPNIFFVCAVKDAVRVLMKDERIKKDLIETSDFLAEIENMQKRLFENT